MQKILKVFGILITVGVFQAFACAPLTKSTVVVGKYHSSVGYEMHLSGEENLYKKYHYHEIGEYYPLFGTNDYGLAENVDTSHLKSGNNIVIVTYQPSSGQRYFHVDEIAKITCGSDGNFIVEKMNKNQLQYGECRPDLLGDQELLSELKSNYGTCENLNFQLQKNDIVLRYSLPLLASFALLGFLYFWRKKIKCKH